MANIEVLEQLRRVVKDAPDDLLHMNRCVDVAECGTARCALGWAAIDPWFIANTELPFAIPPTHSSVGFPTYAIDRAADIFGISRKDATVLFAGNSSFLDDPHAISKRSVLRRIDALIAGKPIKPYKGVRE